MAISECRLCGSSDLRLLLDMGDQPLANRLLSSAAQFDDELAFPLRLLLCEECGLMQLGDTVAPKLLFFDYPYYTGMSRTYCEHLLQAARRYIEHYDLLPGDRVLEVASNDGSFLRHFKDAGIEVLGVEPATKVADVAEARGIPTRRRFFTLEVASGLDSSGFSADLVLANNILAHVADIKLFVRALARVLHPHGRIIAEFPYGGDFLQRCEFDTIYHEHIFYYTLRPLMLLFGGAGLRIEKVEHLPVHGGSLRLFAGHQADVTPFPSVDAYLDAELSGNLHYAEFSNHAYKTTGLLRAAISRLKTDGKRVAAYGAAAKGHTLLNFAGLDHNDIDFIADITPHKCGKFAPGSHIPIVPTSHLLERRPDVTLLLIWNWADEARERERAYVEAGGRLVTPQELCHA